MRPASASGDHLESLHSEASHESYVLPGADVNSLRAVQEECEALHTALRDIAQAVIQDADASVADMNDMTGGVEGDLTSDIATASPYAKSTPLR